MTFENKPASGLVANAEVGIYRFLGEQFTITTALRKPHLPAGYSIADMANDYAQMIREEFGGPVDIIGTSTGGSIALQFAVDHPELVRRLIVHSAAHTLGPVGREVQLKVGELARQRRWREAWAAILRPMLPAGAGGSAIAASVAWFLALSAPKDPSDLVTTIEAEDRFALQSRLGEIKSPTLVIAGTADPFTPRRCSKRRRRASGRQARHLPGNGAPSVRQTVRARSAPLLE